MRWLLCFCLLLPACGNKAPRGLWTDPSLDAGTLASGVVIGGIEDLTRERDLYETQRDAERLQKAFAAQRPDVPLTAWGEARATVAPDSFDAVLTTYRRTGRLGPRELEELSVLQSKGRYVAMARIDLDQTLWDYQRRNRESADRVVVDIEPESRREISLIFDLYDLRTRRLAYTIPVTRTGIEHGTLRTVEGIDAVPTESEIRNAIDDIDRSQDKPQPADRANLIDSVLREALKYLPR